MALHLYEGQLKVRGDEQQHTQHASKSAVSCSSSSSSALNVGAREGAQQTWWWPEEFVPQCKSELRKQALLAAVSTNCRAMVLPWYFIKSAWNPAGS
jgi:hypothetical protein